MSEPLLAALAARGERLTVAALPWVAPVYRAMAGVAAVEILPFAHGRLDWSARRALGRSWRGRHARAYVLPNSLKAALLPWFAGIPARIGYLGERRYGLLNHRLPNPGGRPPMVAFYLALAGAGPGPAAASARAASTPAAVPADGTSAAADVAGAAHADPLAGPRPCLQVPEARIEAVLQAQGLQRGGYVVMAPGAEYGPAKCWPAAHYAELARRVHGREGLPVLLLGSAKEGETAQDIVAAAGPGCRSLVGATSLDEAIALIAGAGAAVSNDSGLMHVAAAFGLPQVAVFGSSSPEHTPPLNSRAQVLWLKDELGLSCAPCFERRCPLGHTRCLVEVKPERVAAALDASRALPAASAGLGEGQLDGAARAPR